MYKRCTITAIDGASVKIDDICFYSNILSRNLKDKNEVIAYIVTSGTELDAWADAKTDFLEQFWAKAVCEHILGNTMRKFNNEMQLLTDAKLLSRMNPGSLEDWPITQQPLLFKLLGNPQKKIGVVLSDSCLMSPIKSVSGIIFRTEKEFINCMCCPRENCSGRRIPYDPHYADELKGKINCTQ
jgi:hypothetical protein